MPIFFHKNFVLHLKTASYVCSTGIKEQIIKPQSSENIPEFWFDENKPVRKNNIIRANFLSSKLGLSGKIILRITDLSKLRVSSCQCFWNSFSSSLAALQSLRAQRSLSSKGLLYPLTIKLKEKRVG